jgi:hypothetical protein
MIYGLRVRSEVEIHHGRHATAEGAADLEIVIGSGMRRAAERPDGTLLAGDALSENEWYSFVRQPSGSYVLRYASICDFLVEPDLNHVVVHIVDGADPEMVSVFAAGALPAFVLILRGAPVLHASAVDVGGEVLAFVGQSGMGKSTMAALTCAAGGQIVTDDVLRLEMDGHPRCYLGAAELRLRRDPAGLTDRFAHRPESRRTADGREAMKLTQTPSELLPLGAIVIPFPDRAATELSVCRLDPLRAVLGLASFPRFVGWEDPTTQAEQFQHLGEVCDRVPVFTAHLPWGPPFPTNLSGSLLGAVGVGQSLLSPSIPRAL